MHLKVHIITRAGFYYKLDAHVFVYNSRILHGTKKGF